MSLNSLIFDLDGTLADTEEGHRLAFNLAFERFRLDWNWDRSLYLELLRTHGGKERLHDYIARLALTPTERKRLQELVPKIHAEKNKFYTSVVRDGAIPLRAGVSRLLDEARSSGCRLALASSTTRQNVDVLLQATLGERATELFAVIACGDQVAAKKPAPDIYRLVLEQLDMPPRRAVAFEDSVNGLRAAVAAGLWTIVTPTFWTEQGDFACAGLVLPSLGDPSAPIDPAPPSEGLWSMPWLTFRALSEEFARRQLAQRTTA